MDLLEQYIIENLGFKKEEMDAIKLHFFCNLIQDDWASIELVDNVDLDEDEEIEDFDNLLKLPTGRIACFTDELLHKDTLAQMD